LYRKRYFSCNISPNLLQKISKQAWDENEARQIERREEKEKVRLY
jgi:hypothetical protein